MLLALPATGIWRMPDEVGAVDLPFDLIKLDLRGRGYGKVRSRNLETLLQGLKVTAPGRFRARYTMRGHRGAIEGCVRADGSLRIALVGTVEATFVAAPDAAPGDAGRDVEPAQRGLGPAITGPAMTRPATAGPAIAGRAAASGAAARVAQSVAM